PRTYSYSSPRLKPAWPSSWTAAISQPGTVETMPILPRYAPVPPSTGLLTTTSTTSQLVKPSSTTSCTVRVSTVIDRWTSPSPQKGAATYVFPLLPSPVPSSHLGTSAPDSSDTTSNRQTLIAQARSMSENGAVWNSWSTKLCALSCHSDIWPLV